MAPAFVQATALLEPQVRLAKVNTEAEQALAAHYVTRSTPTLALFVGTQDIGRWVKSLLQ